MGEGQETGMYHSRKLQKSCTWQLIEQQQQNVKEKAMVAGDFYSSSGKLLFPRI